MNNFKRVTLYIMNITDIIALFLAFLISYTIKFRFQMISSINSDRLPSYTVLIMSIIISYFFINILFLYNDDFIKRKKGKELLASLKMVIYVTVFVIIFLFLTKTSDKYSREQFILFTTLAFVFDFTGRIFVKEYILPKFKKGGISEKIVLLTTMNQIESIINKLNQPYNWNFQVVGLVVEDMNLKGETIYGIPVIGNMNSIYTDLLYEEVDSVYVNLEDSEFNASEFIEKLYNIGKTVHINVKEYDLCYQNKVVDKIGAYAVVSYSPVEQRRKRQILFKRLLDILFSIICIPIFLILYIVFGLFIRLESPGKVLMSYVRVGRNGRRFYQYRFRLLRMDAKKRLENNKSPFTLVGRFLKLTHLDGLPMIINILYGDMSFVGCYAPTLHKYLTYTSYQRRNMCTMAGVVGEWSKKSDPDNVIIDEYDSQDKWNLVTDIYIVIEMIIRYITFHSARRYTEEQLQEELQLIEMMNLDKKPLDYDSSVYHKRYGIGYYLYLGIKRMIDIIGALIGILLLSPVFLILGILVAADDGGNPFYGHRRVGLRGKTITVYKFRSMRKDAGDLEKLLTPEQLAQYKKEFKIDNDPRITRVGSFIRKTSLDELPQLFNILKGDISIIGPRPIVEKETSIYGSDIAKLLSVKPGLTGYWQAYARNKATYESGQRQLMELYYVEHQGLWFDIRIFFKTIGSVIKRDGAQ